MKIEANNISHSYTNLDSREEIIVLKDVNFAVKEGQIACLIGPSGCGKSTLLKMIAGLITPKKGNLRSNNQNIIGTSSDRIILFQELFLFDWFTVYQNIEFAYDAKELPATNKKSTIENIIELVGLKGFNNFYPQEISGGMKQRLALGRSLVAEPSMLILDEPFSSLDPFGKQEMELKFL